MKASFERLVKGLSCRLAEYFDFDPEPIAEAAVDYLTSCHLFGAYNNAYVERWQSDKDRRYIRVARNQNGDLEFDDHACVSKGSDNGAYVQAWIWVSDDDLEPEPGPTYDVWIAEQGASDPAPGGHFPGPWTWAHCGMTFTCDDDPDGKGARCYAHKYARYLRETCPCAYVAVRRADQGPPPRVPVGD